MQKGKPISDGAFPIVSSAASKTESATLILRGGELATVLRRQIRLARAQLLALGGKLPRLATLAVDANPAANAYRASIEKTMRRVEIDHLQVDLPVQSTEADLKEVLHALSADEAITGVLVLMPLPRTFDIGIVYEHLNPLNDVDGVTPVNAGRLHLGLPGLAPSTPNGGIALLDHYQVPMVGARAVVIGRSNVVGRPLAALLQRRNATVAVCHSLTDDIHAYTNSADIIALAVGIPRFLRPAMIKPGAAVLDFGINVMDGRIVGDADYQALLGVAGAITPVPGGTGPITALMLARNTIAAGFAGLHGDLDSIPPFEEWASLPPVPG